MLRFSVPPGYRRSKPPVRPKLDGFTGVIDRILEEDQGRPRKQRHTARRIFERLKAEHGFAGGETIVKAYVRERRLQGQEMFVPLVHPPGHGQADFGEAVAGIGGEGRRNPFFFLYLPHSDACFVKAYPAGTAGGFLGGGGGGSRSSSLDLPHSAACFVRASRAETAEAFWGGHGAAFLFGRRAGEHALRKPPVGGGAHPGRRPPPAHPGLRRVAIALPL